MKARMTYIREIDKSISCSSKVQDESKDCTDGRERQVHLMLWQVQVESQDGTYGRERCPSPALAGYKMKARMAHMGERDKSVSCSSRVQDERKDGTHGRERQVHLLL